MERRRGVGVRVGRWKSQLVAVYNISCLGSLLGGLLVLAAPLTRHEWLELYS